MSLCLILSLSGEFTMKPVSLWVVSDLSTSSGRQMILNILKFMVNQYYYLLYLQCIIIIIIIVIVVIIILADLNLRYY